MSEMRTGAPRTNPPGSTASVGRDALGIVLMVVAVLSGVSVVMAVIRPAEQPGGLTALYTTLVDWIGPVAGLFLSAGVFAIGVRLWMAGIGDRIGRDLLGVLVTTVTLAMLVGTVTPDWAGRLGSGLGGAVTRRLTVFVGLPFGLACVLLPAWFFWLRTWKRGQPGNPNRAQESRTSAPPRAVVPDEGGVSAAEAAALLPAPRARPADFTAASSRTAETAAYKPATPQRTTPPSPYPPDVRVHGGIPEGAQPLPPAHAQSLPTSPPRVPAVPRGTVGDSVHGVERADPHLAAAGFPPVARAAPAPVHERGPVHHRPAPPVRDDDAQPAGRAEAQPAAQPGLAPLAPPEVDFASSELDSTDELPVAEPEPARAVEPELTPVSAVPPPPSWEQPGLFDEEPVDAYGTPLSLVESLRKEVEPAPPPESDSEPAACVAAEPEPLAASAEPRSLFDDEVDAESEPSSVAGDEGGAAHVLDTDEIGAELDFEQPAAASIDEPAESAEPLEPIASGHVPAAADVELPTERAPEETSAAVELTPAPRVARKTAAAAPALVLPSQAPETVSDDLVYRAGCLFLERGRVAVSMLQREFGLDFKAATEVLDQLQRAGLIGPYLGGQRRDILLTREQWNQRVGAA